MRWSETANGPIVVGGLGGSGTRVVAQILRDAGVYIGHELNASLDNLWFTLLFRRPSIKNPNDDALMPLLDLFAKRMHGQSKWSTHEQRLLWSSAFEFIRRRYVPLDRVGFPLRTLRSIYKSHNGGVANRWGWKEPNSHVFLPLLMRRFPNLRYVHVLRHPADAVFGTNKLQLNNWKHLYNINEPNEARAMLLFHQAANRFAIERGQRLGGQFLLLKYEDLCAKALDETRKLLRFAGVNVDDKKLEILSRIPNIGLSKPRVADVDDAALLGLISGVAAEFGYPVYENTNA